MQQLVVAFKIIIVCANGPFAGSTIQTVNTKGVQTDDGVITLDMEDVKLNLNENDCKVAVYPIHAFGKK